MKKIIDYVAEHAKNFPDKKALITPEKFLTYGELLKQSQDYAENLISNGLKRGEIVVLRASQTADYVVKYLGIHFAGGVVCALEKSTSDEKFSEIKKSFEGKICDEDSAEILFTTGTTGASKGVELSHRAIVATAENLIEGCEYKNDTIIIVPGPLNHANAVRKLYATFVNGSSIYILDGMINIKAFYNALDYSEGIIACCLPPAAIRTIFQLTGEQISNYKNKIDFIESATAPLPETDKIKICELLPTARLYNNYGASEVSVCIYDYNAHKNKINCVGKPMKNSKILIVDENHHEIKSSKNNPGFIACGGDTVMKGYINDPELTAKILQNGIVYTSDLGYIDDEGFVYVIGRQGDVINVGGLKVAPTEVESAALGFEGVSDCICVPVDDKITGQALKLLVVINEGKFNSNSLFKYLSTKLEAYKVPRFYEQVEKVERTYNGKINRKFYVKKE